MIVAAGNPPKRTADHVGRDGRTSLLRRAGGDWVRYTIPEETGAE